VTEFWEQFNQIQRYAFFQGGDCVNKVPISTGQHIEFDAAEELVGDMDREISTLRQQLVGNGQNTPVGAAEACPINKAATVSRFPINRVPVGTKLYTTPQVDGSESVAMSRGIAIALAHINPASTEYNDIVNAQGDYETLLKHVEDYDREHLLRAAFAHLEEDEAKRLLDIYRPSSLVDEDFNDD